ncbi:MAG: ATP-binding protein [Clostridium sp.]|nr:ATP-binding protein [Acetatifactor muris]MCM1563429.1 ATP-binding protein [Clostridium sp.]
MAFVGRETELNYLEQHFNAEDNRILVVYGQKGVGKTALLKEFGQDKTCAYYMARPCSDREQRYQWAGELRPEKDGENAYPEYGEIFGRLRQSGGAKISGRDASREGKLLLVIDEFHHIVKGNGNFFAELAEFVKGHAGPVLAILCSSAAGWVENHLVEKIGSGVLSISGFLKVRELPIQRMRELYPEYGEDDCVQLYAALGGVPGLWRRTDTAKSAGDNLIDNLLSRYGALHGEMADCLAGELREPAVYNTILAALAAGRTKLNDIYRHTGFSRAKISVYLKNLMEIDLVEKTGAGVYRITKPHVRFYFCFIYPNQSLLEELTPRQFYKEIVEDDFPGFVREAYRKS